MPELVAVGRKHFHKFANVLKGFEPGKGMDGAVKRPREGGHGSNQNKRPMRREFESQEDFQEAVSKAVMKHLELRTKQSGGQRQYLRESGDRGTHDGFDRQQIRRRDQQAETYQTDQTQSRNDQAQSYDSQSPFALEHGNIFSKYAEEQFNTFGAADMNQQTSTSSRGDPWAQVTRERPTTDSAKTFLPQLTPTPAGRGAKKLINFDLPKTYSEQENRALNRYSREHTSNFNVGLPKGQHFFASAQHENPGVVDEPDADDLMSAPGAKAVQEKLLENLNKRLMKSHETSSMQSSPTKNIDMFSDEQANYFRIQVKELFPTLPTKILTELLQCRQNKELFLSDEVQAALLTAIDFRNVDASNLQGGLSKSQITQIAKNGAIVAAFVPRISNWGTEGEKRKTTPSVRASETEKCIAAAIANRIAIKSKTSKFPCGYCLQQLCEDTATIKFVGASSNKPGRSFGQLVTSHKRCPEMDDGIKYMMLLTDTRHVYEQIQEDTHNENLDEQGDMQSTLLADNDRRVIDTITVDGDSDKQDNQGVDASNQNSSPPSTEGSLEDHRAEQLTTPESFPVEGLPDKKSPRKSTPIKRMPRASQSPKTKLARSKTN